jgi:hypothetical protein
VDRCSEVSYRAAEEVGSLGKGEGVIYTRPNFDLFVLKINVFIIELSNIWMEIVLFTNSPISFNRCSEVSYRAAEEVGSLGKGEGVIYTRPIE